MDNSLFALLVVSLTCLVQGLAVGLSRNITKQIKLSFLFMLIGLVGWLINLYVSNISSDLALMFNRIVYIGPIVMLTSFAVFLQSTSTMVRSIGSRVVRSLLYGKKHLIILSAFVSVMSVLPLNVESIQPRLDSSMNFSGYNIVFGPLNILVSLFIVVLSGVCVFRLYSAYKYAVSMNDKKAKKILFKATISTAIVLLTTNLILPIAGKGSELGNFVGTLSVILFVSGVMYSILRYKFLDLRVAAARAAAYLISLSSIGLLYGLASYALLRLTQVTSSMTSIQQIMVIAFSIVTAIAFHPLKNWFDTLTRSLFFRYAYKTEDLLEEFSQEVSSQYELKPLVQSSVSLIKKYFEPEEVRFFIYDPKESSGVINVTGASTTMNRTDFKKIYSTLENMNARLLKLKDLGLHEQVLSRLMKQQNIEIIVDLSAGTRRVGFFTLAHKKNGNTYTQQDTQMLEIVSDELALAVQNAIRFDQIEKFNETLQQEVEAATRKLKRSNEKLKALDVAKDEFISMASHQLRTPLTSIKGYVSMVLEGDVGKINPDQAKMLDQAYISSQRMVYLIADLLNVSRLRTGKFVIDRSKMYLPDVVEGEISQLYGTFEARGLKIKYDKPKEFPQIMLDETKIRQVIMNFTDNAIYYTPKGGLVTIAVKATRTSVSLTVTDSGIGVPKSEIPHLFTKFYRAANARKARPDGTGLGLFMAKKVIVAQGGAMIFKTKEGKGSTFGFVFPRSKIEVKD